MNKTQTVRETAKQLNNFEKIQQDFANNCKTCPGSDCAVCYKNFVDWLNGEICQDDYEYFQRLA